MRNDLAICDRVANRWCSDDIRWPSTLWNPVFGRLGWFECPINCSGKNTIVGLQRLSEEASQKDCLRKLTFK